MRDAAQLGLDLVGDPCGLVLGAGAALHVDRARPGALRPHGRHRPGMRVCGDHRPGRGNDGCTAAVVAHQLVGLGGELVDKGGKPARVRAAEAVDGLVRVADGEHRRGGGEERHQPVLSLVHVLEFVHEQVAGGPAHGLGRGSTLFQDLHRAPHHRLEVDLRPLGEQLGVPGQLGRIRRRGAGAKGPAEGSGELVPLAGGAIGKQLVEQAGALLRPGHAQLRCLPAQLGEAIAVEGGHPHPLGTGHALQPRAHLGRRLVGEGDHRAGPVRHRGQPLYPADQGVGLAGAGSGLDEDARGRAGNRPLLLGVERPLHRRDGHRRPGAGQADALSFAGGLRRLRDRCEQLPLAAQGGALAFGEHPDHSEFAVIAGVADHPVGAQPLDRLGHQGEAARPDLLHRGVEEQAELGAEGVDQAHVAIRGLAARRPAAEQFSGDLQERDEAVHRRRTGRVHGLRPVGQFHHPVEHADGQRPAAVRAEAAVFAGPGRLQADAALAMAVAVVLALFRVELHRGREPLVAGRVLRGADGLAQAEKIEAGGKEVGLAAELGGRVTVGVGDEGEAVQGRDEPVHLRVRGEAGLQGEDLVAQIAETLLDGVEPGLGAEQGKPRGPDVGRNEEPLRRLVEQNFEQVAGIQPEDGPAVRGDVAERGELGVETAHRIEIRQVEQVVDLAHPAAALVDGADLGREDKTDVRGAGRRPDALGHQARPVDGLVR